MKHQDIRKLVEKVREGKLPRRDFIQKMVAVGITAPMASMTLMHYGVANAQTAITYKPTKRGGGGPLKLIYWQAPVHLNPHYAGGTKDQDASRIFYEPLAGWDTEGNLIPYLAAEIPSRANGGLADGEERRPGSSSAVSSGTTASDFTADDVVFTAPMQATLPRHGDHRHLQGHQGHQGRLAHGAHRVPAPHAVLGRGSGRAAVGLILPKHVFEPFMGAKSRENPANLKPVGTGPYKIVDFKPGDMHPRRSQQGLPRRPTSPSSTRWRSRAAAMPPARRAPCCRPGV
jgi:peptide/nickel transport system substrate-binding protein